MLKRRSYRIEAPTAIGLIAAPYVLPYLGEKPASDISVAQRAYIINNGHIVHEASTGEIKANIRDAETRDVAAFKHNPTGP